MYIYTSITLQLSIFHLHATPRSNKKDKEAILIRQLKGVLQLIMIKNNPAVFNACVTEVYKEEQAYAQNTFTEFNTFINSFICYSHLFWF